MAVVNPMELELRNTEFRNRVLMMLQQETSSLRGAVEVGTGYVSKTTSPVEYMAPVDYVERGARGALLQPVYPQFQRRWVSPTDKELAIRIDKFDQLRTLTDPRSVIGRSVDAAGVRRFDDVIMAAFFGPALIGEDPVNQTTETFASGANFPQAVTVAQDFGTGVDNGVSVAKIIEGLRILSKYENNIDMMPVHMGMTSQGMSDLMKSAEFTSTDFRAQATYDERGRPKAFMGVQFHYSEAWPYAAGDATERYLPMWVQDGMHLGIWMDISTNITQETLVSGQPWQLYGALTIGATRLQAGKVVRISATDATGGRI